MKHLKTLGTAVTAGSLVLALAACTAGEEAGKARAERTASNGDVFNRADVDFATRMIPHHAEALAMVDLTRERDVSPELAELTQAIQAAQGPEIELMVDWLTTWDQPVPETMRDHANAEGHGMVDDQMVELEAADDGRFESMWLEMMIEHHRGAVEMAQDEQDDGVFGPAKQLAESIEASQQAEISRMEQLSR